MIVCLTLEGSLIGADLIDQIADGTATGQRAADFNLDSRHLTDEIAAAWTDATAFWSSFQRQLSKLSNNDSATSLTRDQWLIPLLRLFGYELTYMSKAADVDGISYAISYRAGADENSPPVHLVGCRQELERRAESGRPRLSPHALVQEYLNRTEHLWGVIANGYRLRLLRNSQLIRRQSFIEFDLRQMMETGKFADFALLFRLLHRTRLPRDAETVKDCLLEHYHQQTLEQGGRVRDRLRDGVEEALKRFANALLSHPKNEALRAELRSRKARLEDYYQQLLRLVYRLLFLMVAEERDLLKADAAADTRIYRENYGIQRLRRLLDVPTAYNDYEDLWLGMQSLFEIFQNEKMAVLLQVSPLNGDLFDKSLTQLLNGTRITNRQLLEALWCLAKYQPDSRSSMQRVNYAALDVEELGSIYESLLDYHPVIIMQYEKPEFDLVYGSGRKSTGSYYTPHKLVDELIESTLVPVFNDRLSKAKSRQEKESAILNIRACDPACGSGHFLLAAARTLAKELARIRTGEDEPTPAERREAIRDVIGKCIYGVDKNPLAVDLCKVALWIEGNAFGKPLKFIDHRIRCGDSLVGVFHLDVLKGGIPDKAFDSLQGDDKVAARKMAKRNRDERTGQRGLFSWNPSETLTDFKRTSLEVDAIADDSPDESRRKKRIFEQSKTDPDWLRKKQECDLWTAAFFQPLKKDGITITTGPLIEHLDGGSIDLRLIASAEPLAVNQRFFHWPLEFPEVFDDGGFDVILSNPPWEHVELKEQEFFAARDNRIANAPTKAERARLIHDLKESDPALYNEFEATLRGFDAARLFLAHGARYPLTARGRINTYAVFAELSRTLIRSSGRSGIIVQSDIATNDTYKFFFQDLIERRHLVSFHDFVNTEGIFPAVHRTHPHFCLLTVRGNPHDGTPLFSFWNTNTSQLRDENRRFTLSVEEFTLLNPNTGNCPIFHTQADAELTKSIYRRVPVLWREAAHGQQEVNPWKLKFAQGLFNMASDSHHFRTARELEADGYRRDGNLFVNSRDRYLPLYEAKMLHQFDHRWATYEERESGKGRGPQTEARDVTLEEKRDMVFMVQPRYWVREEVTEPAIPRYPEPLAAALQVEHRASIQRLLCWWIAGYKLNRGDKAAADHLLYTAGRFDLHRSVARTLLDRRAEQIAADMELDFPLTNADEHAIIEHLDAPESIARALIERFSPKWFLGWRDITNSTNERTTISAALPKSAVGDTFLLMFSQSINTQLKLALAANLNSFVQDYGARQKVGGTHMKYNVFRQLAVLPPETYSMDTAWDKRVLLTAWMLPRILELMYTSHDLAAMARECGYGGLPILWNEERRFEIRCELDAAFFHLYLPSEASGKWKPANGETLRELAALTHHFPTPRDAVAHILEQFPIIRQKDEQAYARYRTRERILEIYDEMLAAYRTGQPYRTLLNPPPGEACA